MDDFIGKLKEEKKALGEKLDKLNVFRDSEKIRELEYEQQRLIARQEVYMRKYYNCLVLRLDLLKKN